MAHKFKRYKYKSLQMGANKRGLQNCKMPFFVGGFSPQLFSSNINPSIGAVTVFIIFLKPVSSSSCLRSWTVAQCAVCGKWQTLTNVFLVLNPSRQSPICPGMQGLQHKSKSLFHQKWQQLIVCKGKVSIPVCSQGSKVSLFVWGKALKRCTDRVAS